MLIPAVLDAVAARIDAIDELTVTTNPGVTVVAPMAVVSDEQMQYHSTFSSLRGFSTLEMRVRIYVSEADDEQGALEIRNYKSAHGGRSISKAIETATLAADDFPNGTLVATVGDTGVVENGGKWLVLDVSVTAEIPGEA